jgi:hypothetical protein
MADNTLYGTRGFLHGKQGGPVLNTHTMLTRRINGSTAKVGHVVTSTGETQPDVALAITTDEKALGVIVYPTEIEDVLQSDPDWNIDTAIPDNKDIDIAKLGSGAIVACFLEAAAGPIPVERGDKIAIGTEAGKVRKFAYTDAASETDTLEEVIGYAHEASDGHATDDLIILVELR